MFYCYAHEEDKKLLESKKIVDPKRKGFMTYKSSRLLYACAVIMLVILSACSQTTSTNIDPGTNPGILDPHKQYTVNFWETFDTGANKTALTNLVKQYTDTHKNVKINLQSYDSYRPVSTILTIGYNVRYK